MDRESTPTAVATIAIRNYAAAALACEERWTRFLFAIMASSGLTLGLACLAQLQALADHWPAFVSAWRSLLG